MIYMDNAATMKPMYVARHLAEQISQKSFGNPNSQHAFGLEAKKLLEQARQTVADCLGADADEIYFTSGATESCRIGLKTLETNCNYILIDHAVHSALADGKIVGTAYNTGHRDASQNGFVYSLANNETGDIMKLIPNGKDLFFLDITAACGHIPIDLHKLGVDYAAAGAHKFGGMAGVGILYARKNAPVPVYLDGKTKRGGTPPVSLIYACAKALKWQTENMDESIRKITSARDYLEKQIVQKIQGTVINAQKNGKRLPHITNISFGGVENTALAAYLSEKGIYVSTGAACESDKIEPSRVLLAMGFSEERARSAIRFSLSAENTKEECDFVVKTLADADTFLRNC